MFLMLPSSLLTLVRWGRYPSGPPPADRPQNLGAMSFIVTRISQAIGEIDAPHVDAALLDAFLIDIPLMVKSERSPLSAVTDRQITPPWLV